MRLTVLIGLLCGLLISCVQAASGVIYRNYWYPTYHGQRVAYCLLGDKTCGRPVADLYCQTMGYKKSKHIIKGYNVGLTRYLVSNARCQGWTCNGFKMIQCAGEIRHAQLPSFAHRSREFVLPRFNNYRVAWCYVGGRDCGDKVAQSFCKRMAYLKAIEYIPEDYVLATSTLKEQSLCFGPQCKGFAKIICYR